jgi:N-acetylmuramoyl-L-alanine amidase
VILPLALALQAATLRPTMLLVKCESTEAVVPIVTTSRGPAVDGDAVARTLGGTLRRLANGHFELRVPGLLFELVDQVPFANLAGEVIPLTGAPFLSGGTVYVPLQLVTEVMPRRGTGYVFTAEQVELRYFPADRPAPRPGQTVFAKPLPRPPLLRTTPDSLSATPPSEAPHAWRDSVTPISAAAPPAPVRRLTPAARPPDDSAPAQKRLVVVDAGHGGVDNGTHGPLGRRRQFYEKDITLAVAKKLAEALRKRGVDVLMTRTADTLIGLYDRGPIANAHHGDLFVSIHVNAPGSSEKRPSKVRGVETYFLSEAKTEDERRVEKMENSAVRFETGADAPKNDPLGFIINDMAQNEHLRESQDLAETVQEYLARVAPGPNRGVKQAGLVVLNTAYMPAVLVEIGFVTNVEESVFLTSATKQRVIANAIADATVAYLARYERRVRPGTP